MKKVIKTIIIMLLLVGFTLQSYAESFTGLEMVEIPNRKYMIAKTEVTQKLYEEVMGENPSYFKGEDNPVECVSWYDAIMFCNKLSEKEGLKPAYKISDIETAIDEYMNVSYIKNAKFRWDQSANGYRLPTSTEWTFAAIGGENYKYAGANYVDVIGWYRENSNRRTHPVALKNANGYGLYDMNGNVKEWCNNYRFRGGSYDNDSIECELRWSNDDGGARCEFGFRLCRNKVVDYKSQSYVKTFTGLEVVEIPEQKYVVAKTEVTQELYESVMGENPSCFKGGNLPVECVSFYDCIYFCNKLSEKYGYTPVYSVNGLTDVTKWGYSPHDENSIDGTINQDIKANGYRLPTREEWNTANEDDRKRYSYSDVRWFLNDVCWYVENSNMQTHPVGQKKANDYGLYDMSGNVEEWCWDDYSKGLYRIRLGGSWQNSNEVVYYGEHSLREGGDGVSAYDRDYTIGFRLVRTVKE